MGPDELKIDHGEQSRTAITTTNGPNGFYGGVPKRIMKIV